MTTLEMVSVLKSSNCSVNVAADSLDQWFNERIEPIMRALADLTRAVDGPVERGPMLPRVEE